MEKVKRILIVSTDRNLREVLNFCFDGWGYEVFLHDAPLHDITRIKKISPHAIVVDVHSASKAQLEICRLLKDDFLTALIPIITLINKRQLRGQLLSLKHGVDDYLIKPPDPLDLRVRIEMAMKRAQYSSFSNPLTGLPGGAIIEEALKEKLKGAAPFSFGYLDIDNFKYFNDAYGYLKGDRVLMQTAYLLYTAVKGCGNRDDFIGHIGGDDFVFLTTLERWKGICEQFLRMFDDVIPFHYSPQDRAQGYIVARDRTNQMKKVPLMSASLAVVNVHDTSERRNVIEINDRIAEIKRYLKGIPGSKCMADRRDRKGGGISGPHRSKKSEGCPDTYRPLGQILLERNLVSAEQLDEALRVHWKRGILLGEILTELGMLKEDELREVLSSQKMVHTTYDEK